MSGSRKHKSLIEMAKLIVVGVVIICLVILCKYGKPCE